DGGVLFFGEGAGGVDGESAGGHAPDGGACAHVHAGHYKRVIKSPKAGGKFVLRHLRHFKTSTKRVEGALGHKQGGEILRRVRSDVDENERGCVRAAKGGKRKIWRVRAGGIVCVLGVNA